MNHRYQVVLWISEKAEFQTVEVVAAKKEDVANIFARPGVEVRHVAHMWEELNWNQQTFDRQEQAAYLRRSVDFVDEKAGKGLLPKSPSGIHTRRQLDAFIEQGKAA